MDARAMPEKDKTSKKDKSRKKDKKRKKDKTSKKDKKRSRRNKSRDPPVERGAPAIVSGGRLTPS